MKDLSTNFYITEKDIGKPRAEVCTFERIQSQVCLPKLRDLNPFVNVTRREEEITEDYLKSFRVLCNRFLSTAGRRGNQSPQQGACRSSWQPVSPTRSKKPSMRSATPTTFVSSESTTTVSLFAFSAISASPSTSATSMIPSRAPSSSATSAA